ncbi:MAG TPA: phosphodiester glycosidase family protein [Clostridiaceae bacterium]|nr:phosphodiester glycosidase family protein [Clostridiaceae bacterium]
MNYRRKRTITIILSLLLLFWTLIVPAYAESDFRVIYETVNYQTITSGVTYENITRFTVEGWLNINVIRVDLSNENIEIDTLANTDSLNKLTSTKTLAESRGAVAAINASFFTPTGNGTGYPDGPIVESGKIISSTSEYNLYGNYMASFSLDSFNNAFYDFWKSSISLLVPEGEPIAVGQFNKPSRVQYKDYTVIDRRWSDTSIGASEEYPDIVEMVVIEGKVVEFRQGQPPIPMPENGYVVVTREQGGIRLMECFKPGDDVELSITTTPDWNNYKMSVTGSSILVKDGKIPDKFSFDLPYISKRQPRTAIGTSKDGKQLILVTVDGRQNSSIGLTQLETARLMLDLGAYNAINFDGGGSTTMVGRPLGSNNLKVLNSPSDGIVRTISTAIGIFSIAPPGPLAGLVIESEDENVFVNTSRAFTVKGYDKYFNPVSVDPSLVSWSVSGISGNFKDNVLYPQSVGEGTVTARVGDISVSANISSLSSPVKLVLERKEIKLSTNQTQKINITGFNKNGFKAKISPEDVNWFVTDDLGEFNNGIFTAKKPGTGYISASIGNIHSYCALTVISEENIIADYFENLNGSFISYPSYVTGEYELSSEHVRTGNYSGRLAYNFTESEETQAAYLVFSNDGIPLEPRISKIGVWVYNSSINSNWLRAEIIDSSGKKHLVSLSQNMDWTGWKYVEASLDNINSPALLTRLYIAKVHPIADSGSIFFDNLNLVYSITPQTDFIEIPEDTVYIDEDNVSEIYQATPGSFRFSVFGQSRNTCNLLENILVARLNEKINKYIDYGVFVGNYSQEASLAIEKPLLPSGSGYASVDIESTRFIRLDTSKGGLRATDPEQWFWLYDQLESFNGNNIMIFLESSPNYFNDNLEAGLFKETLTEYRKKTLKNIWVFFKGQKNESYMERGIKYISTAGFDIEDLKPDNADQVKYVLVTVKGNRVIYEFKPIL